MEQYEAEDVGPKPITPVDAVPPSLGDYTRRQHLVPRWYLSRFASNNRLLRISVDDRVRETVSPKGAAWKPHFYSVRDPDGNRDDRIEKFFGVIENDASIAVEAVVNGGFPLADE